MSEQDPLVLRLTLDDRSFIRTILECKTKEDVITTFVHPKMSEVQAEMGRMEQKLRIFQRRKDEADLATNSTLARLNVLKHVVEKAREFITNPTVNGILIDESVKKLANIEEEPVQLMRPEDDGSG